MKFIKSLNLPIAIIIAGIIISAGIIFVRGNFAEKINKPSDAPEQVTENKIEIRPVDKSDHIFGNPNAPVIIVEYTDFECPFCQEFHVTMKRVMEDFGKDGKVAWVIRHFPIEKIHENARRAAIASECVAKYKGDGAFFDYSNMLFENAPDSLSEDNTKQIILDLGVTEEEYNSCTTDTTIIEKIERDIKDGEIIYAHDPNFGTPYSFIITNAGIQTTISGSQSYTIIKEIIELFI